MTNEEVDQRDKQEVLVGEESSSEAMLFARLFHGDSGVRFNFDEVREFLRDPHIALIASDLTLDENLDNIERVLKRMRRKKHKLSPNMWDTGSAQAVIHESLEAIEEPTQNTSQTASVNSVIQSRPEPDEHSAADDQNQLECKKMQAIPILCRELLRREPRELELQTLWDLKSTINLLFRMFFEKSCDELISYVIY